MFDMVSTFAHELRRLQVPVSLAEMTDAVAAIRAGDLHDRDDLRALLRATMVKRVEHLAAFDAVFDLFFGPDRAFRPGPGEPSPQDVYAAMDDDALVAAAHTAVSAANRMVLDRIAEVAVDRWAEMEEGRPVAGRTYVFRVLRRLDVDGATQSVAPQSSADSRESFLETRLQADRVAAAADHLRAGVELEVRRRLVADRGPAEVARLVRPTVPERIGFMNASSAEMTAMRDVTDPLARRLATRLAQRRAAQDRGRLDFRRTFRASLSSGGVPVTLRFRPPPKPRPELVVIADVSGSVSTFARFTLQFLYAIRLQFRKVRTFAFIDDLVEVTDVLLESVTAEQAFAAIRVDPRLIWLDGRSDYGHAFETFDRRYSSAVTSRTSVLILGDGRNNYRATQAERLAGIHRTAAHVFWLNPERLPNWHTGDSAIAAYAPYCDSVVECADLAQLRAFTDGLVT